MSSKCFLICERFLAQIVRNRRGLLKTGRRYWGGDLSYDPTTYDYRVVKSITAGPFPGEYYHRCTRCMILLAKDVFHSCPCCGTRMLTLTHKRGGRRSSMNLHGTILTRKIEVDKKPWGD